MEIVDQIVYRWRLWKICRRLDIKPYTWQRDYALGRAPMLPDPRLRRVGKTTAVILYGLVRNVVSSKDIHKLAERDPDCWQTQHRRFWFFHEYVRTARKAGICAGTDKNGGIGR